ncbi:hypothetical protein BC332_30548 [Capsicum chinense]|nr:hypothetical protein BC332_30548 [Capsicum chinense]
MGNWGGGGNGDEGGVEGADEGGKKETPGSMPKHANGKCASNNFVPVASSQIYYCSSAIRRSSVEKPDRIELRRVDCPSSSDIQVDEGTHDMIEFLKDKNPNSDEHVEYHRGNSHCFSNQKSQYRCYQNHKEVIVTRALDEIQGTHDIFAAFLMVGSDLNIEVIQDAQPFENPIELLINEAFWGLRHEGVDVDSSKEVGDEEILHDLSDSNNNDYFELLKDGSEDLYEGSKYSKLEFLLKLLSHKVLVWVK